VPARSPATLRVACAAISEWHETRRIHSSCQARVAKLRRRLLVSKKYVDAVARHGSIRKAADALHVASSALNRRILDLEESLGLLLFERLPRGVRATAAGEAFLAYARRSLRELRMLEAQLDGLRGLSRGQVAIAVAESVTGRMLPDAIAEYQAAHPGIGFSVTVAGPRALSEELMRDSCDLILTHEPPDLAATTVLASAAQPLCALVAPEHPLAQRSALRLRDCAGFPLAMPDETLAARALIDAALEHTSTKLDPMMVSNSIETTKIFARTSGGVCFSFRIGSKPDVSGMVAIPLEDPGLSESRLFLASRRGRVLPVAAASFAERLSAALERL
jgi:DNA-binding transcriptional LysR family regulator